MKARYFKIKQLKRVFIFRGMTDAVTAKHLSEAFKVKVTEIGYHGFNMCKLNGYDYAHGLSQILEGINNV